MGKLEPIRLFGRQAAGGGSMLDEKVEYMEL